MCCSVTWKYKLQSYDYFNGFLCDEKIKNKIYTSLKLILDDLD